MNGLSVLDLIERLENICRRRGLKQEDVEVKYIVEDGNTCEIMDVEYDGEKIVLK